MDYFMFIVNASDSNSIGTFRRCLEQLTQELGHKKVCPNPAVGKLILTDKNFKIAEVNSADWLPVETISIDPHTAEKAGEAKDDTARSTDEHHCLGRQLLELSESLPYGGVSVHTVLFNPLLYSDTEHAESIESYLPLYGSLKKLSCWHNAEIILTTQGDDDIPSSLQSLADFTGASITSDISTVKWEQSLWRGKVSVMNKMENAYKSPKEDVFSIDLKPLQDGQGHVFPGFQLQCDAEERELFYKRLRRLYLKPNNQSEALDVPVFGRMLEVLDQVDSRTVPPFMLTPYTLRLSLWNHHNHSDVLMQELLEQEQTAVIARLAVYSPDCMIDCTQKLSAQAWKDSLMANVDYAQEREEDLLTSVHFLHLLLLRDDENNHVNAVVLHDATEINSRLFKLESTICTKHHDRPSDQKTESYLDGLFHMTGEMLQQINKSLVRMQTRALQDWIAELEAVGESTVISSEMLWKFLGEIQERFLEELVEDGVISTTVNHDAVKPLTTLESDLKMDPLEWPERHTLQHQDTQKREMRRYQSSESMSLSSPLHADEAVTTVDVKDFLKLFKPDGNASMDKLSPIRQQSKRKLTKLSSQGETTMQWPDCKDTHFHGIDYYKHKISEKNEKHFSNLREKYLKEETCSSFTTKTILTKKKITVTADRRRRPGSHSLMSPTRKSPRGPPMSISQRIEEEDVSIRPSISQPSRQKLLLQHPGLKSPRKRQSLPSHQLRRSPRKQPSASFQRLRSDGDITLPPPPKRKRRSDPDLLDESLEEIRKSGTATSAADGVKKPSRSERHKKKLEEICRSVLVKHGVEEKNVIFKSCADKLFQVTKFFVKALPNSRNLSQEMKNIAEGQVTQVVDLEKRRQEMKKTSKK